MEAEPKAEFGTPIMGWRKSFQMAAKPQESARPSIYLYFVKAIMLIGLVGVLLSICSFFGSSSPVLDLFSHFRWQFVWILVSVALVAVLARLWAYATVFAAAALFNAMFLAILWCPVTSHKLPPNSAELKILDMNLFFENHRYDLVKNEIAKYDPDVIVVEELTAEMLHALQPALKDYPYQSCSVRNDPYGIGIISKVKLENVQQNITSYSRSYVMAADVGLNNRSYVTIAAMHIHPELSLTDFEVDNHILSALKTFAGHTNKLILTGDFNAAPWSALFHKIVSCGHFMDSERGFGLQPSWPAHCGALMIPIDHCLLTPDFRVLSRSTGDFIGSDHMPLFLKIAIPGANN